MSGRDEVARRAGPADGPAYATLHAAVVEAIRHGVSGARSARTAAEEALVRVRSGLRMMSPPAGVGEERLVVTVAAAVQRGADDEVSGDEAAHLALVALRELGVAIPPRGPDDPFPDLSL